MHAWRCHLHPGSDCDFNYEDGNYTHVTPSISRSARIYPIVNDRCRENLGNSLPVSAVLHSNFKYNWSTFQFILATLNYLDQQSFKYTKQNTSLDLAKRHLVIDACGNLKLVNTYLIVICKRPLQRYTSKASVHNLLLCLFPANGERKPCPNRCQFPKSHSAPDWVHTQFCSKWKADKVVAKN